MQAVAHKMSDQQSAVMQHYPMVRAIAYRIHARLPRTVDVDDLVSVGVIGLMEAMDRYDASRSVPFETYARHRIHGAIVDALRAQDWVPRSVRRKADRIETSRRRLHLRHGRAPTVTEMASDLGVSAIKFQDLRRGSEIRTMLSLDAPMASDNTTPLVEQVADDCEDLMSQWQTREVKEAILVAIERLPERERTAIALYYLHELSLKEVGKVLGVTESRSCQICSSAIKRLRFRLRNLLAA
jgi:RNA polymerase sigma factor FliA